MLLVSESGQREGLNGDGNIRHSVVHLVDLAAIDALPQFLRGDANANSKQSITDAVIILRDLFTGGEIPSWLNAADTNDTGNIDLTDAICLLNYLFLGGSPPEEPFPACGPDSTMDQLACRSFGGCVD